MKASDGILMSNLFSESWLEWIGGVKEQFLNKIEDIGFFYVEVINLNTYSHKQDDNFCL